MAKLKLNPEPTFTAPVAIPVPGADPATIAVTFKYRTQAEVDAWMAVPDQTNVQAAQDCVVGWDLDDACTPDNIVRLCDNYGGAAFAIVSTYISELRGARAKN